MESQNTNYSIELLENAIKQAQLEIQQLEIEIKNKQDYLETILNKKD